MELKFDEMEVDTTLAQAFLEDEKLAKVWETMTLTSISIKNPDEAYTEISCKLQKLAVLFKDNVNLFAQLEYLIRKIPIEDSKAQMNLIIQQIYYLSSFNVDEICKQVGDVTDIDEEFYTHISMSQEKPLLNLGYVVRALVYLHLHLNHLMPTIIANKETKALCYLFAKLCHDAGLAVVIQFEDNALKYYAGNEALGTVGVISESSDVDSAVDAFLTSSKQAPWKLRRILVQESVYKQFKDVLTWKCNLNVSGEGKTTSRSTSDTLHLNGRVFLIDAVHISDPQPSEVVVEAYRTTKELLSLLNQYRPRYVSLWANDIAEVNEITQSILSQVVWVNNFADFRGPPRISEAFFSIRSWYHSSSKNLPKTEISKLFELQRSWLKLDSQTRFEILFKTLDKQAAVNQDHHFYTNLKDSVLRAHLNSSGSFVDVCKDYVCLGVPVVSDKIHYCYNPSQAFFNDAFFKSLLRGNTFIIMCLYLNITFLINLLKKAGAPVSAITSIHIDPEESKYTSCHCPLVMLDFDQVTKVIWSNSGTIFAN